MLAIHSIDGKSLAIQPLRDGYQVTKSDLLSSGSGRSAETGTALRYPIRLGTFKLNLKFKGTPSEISQVDELVSRFEQRVRFSYCGQTIEALMYPSDRSMTYSGFTAELSVNLIEI
ncbi:MAG: hypothetical protein K2K14_03740 [Ruminococcus sp.]|nr:hypothetical protein [Ruminococcus sp.]